MTVRPPADAAVALRSLGRRWRGLFAGLAEGESPDDLAHRAGAAGRSPVDHALHATRALVHLRRDLERLLVEDMPLLEAAGDEPRGPDASGSTSGAVEGVIADLAREAEQVAARVERVPASDWQRRARVAGHEAEVQPLDLLWDAVDAAVGELRAAEEVLRETRGRP